MSLYTVAFLGISRIGVLTAGSPATQIGAPRTLLVGGILCVLGSVLFVRLLPLFRRGLRPVNGRLGIATE
ncbi:MAG: hypothetical protein ABI612_17055 [Betaproteobacteria bacterium]